MPRSPSVCHSYIAFLLNRLGVLNVTGAVVKLKDAVVDWLAFTLPDGLWLLARNESGVDWRSSQRLWCSSGMILGNPARARHATVLWIEWSPWREGRKHDSLWGHNNVSLHFVKHWAGQHVMRVQQAQETIADIICRRYDPGEVEGWASRHLAFWTSHQLHDPHRCSILACLMSHKSGGFYIAPRSRIIAGAAEFQLPIKQLSFWAIYVFPLWITNYSARCSKKRPEWWVVALLHAVLTPERGHCYCGWYP